RLHRRAGVRDRRAVPRHELPAGAPGPPAGAAAGPREGGPGVIRVSHLSKSFGDARVLDGVSLEVPQGEGTALVGPSRGGKSTLLRCLNGLEDFQEGEVSVGDVTLAGGRPHPTADLLKLRRRVGMVFQQFHLFPHMTALENVLSGPRYALGQ